MNNIDKLLNYTSQLGLSNELVETVFSNMATILSPDEKERRKTSKMIMRPKMYSKAIELGIPIPRHEGDDLIFDAQEEAMMLAVNLNSEDLGIDLLKYFNLDKYEDRFSQITQEDIPKTLNDKEITFLNNLRGIYDKTTVVPSATGDTPFLEGFIQGWIRSQNDTSS